MTSGEKPGIATEEGSLNGERKFRAQKWKKEKDLIDVVHNW